MKQNRGSSEGFFWPLILHRTLTPLNFLLIGNWNIDFQSMICETNTQLIHFRANTTAYYNLNSIWIQSGKKLQNYFFRNRFPNNWKKWQREGVNTKSIFLQCTRLKSLKSMNNFCAFQKFFIKDILVPAKLGVASLLVHNHMHIFY